MSRMICNRKNAFYQEHGAFLNPSGYLQPHTTLEEPHVFEALDADG